MLNIRAMLCVVLLGLSAVSEAGAVTVRFDEQPNGGGVVITWNDGGVPLGASVAGEHASVGCPNRCGTADLYVPEIGGGNASSGTYSFVLTEANGDISDAVRVTATRGSTRIDFYSDAALVGVNLGTIVSRTLETPGVSQLAGSYLNDGGGTVDLFITSDASPVPGPIVGAGLPGLVMAFGGFLAWRRRKAAAIAA